MKVLIVRNEHLGGVEYHRQIVPAYRINETNKDDFEITIINSVDSAEESFLKDFELVIFTRLISYYGREDETILKVRNAGCKTILDIDDYWILPNDHMLFSNHNLTKTPQHTIASLKYVDAVTCTTKYLAEKIRPYNKNVFIIENAINPNQPQFIPQEEKSERMRFGWIGGQCHLPDLKTLVPSIQRFYIDKNLVKNAQLILGGFTLTSPIKEENEYIKFEKIFTNNYRGVTSEQSGELLRYHADHNSTTEVYRRIYGTDIYNYGFIYKSIDVALAPLRYNDFNLCKSELKILEAGFMKKAIICSDLPNYRFKNTYKVTTDKNNSGWFNAIKSLAMNRNKAQDMALALHEEVSTYYHIDNINKKRIQLWKNISSYSSPLSRHSQYSLSAI